MKNWTLFYMFFKYLASRGIPVQFFYNSCELCGNSIFNAGVLGIHIRKKIDHSHVIYVANHFNFLIYCQIKKVRSGQS